MLKTVCLLFLFVAATGCVNNSENELEQQPNILFIYLDDMGYGDPQCYNAESQIPTPNINKLAKEGMMFTDMHSAAPVCGPSRYGLLTGRYPWRRGKGGCGNGAKFRDVFIENGRLTIASMLKEKGYNTAQIGKWGLRHNYSDAVKPGMEPGTKKAYDFPNKPLLGAQLFGFDYSWTLTYLYPEPRIDTMLGIDPVSDAKIVFENSLPVDTSLQLMNPYEWFPESAKKVMEYLETFAGKKEYPKFGLDGNRPFFIYWDPIGPHTPYVVKEEFRDKSKAGQYGDYVFEIDHYIGLILKQLDDLNLADNTLVIFSSDNGPDKHSYPRIKEYNHYGMGKWRGLKTDSWEGGNRVPFIARWPGNIAANSVNNSQVCLTDMMATFLEIVGDKLPDNVGEDSFNFLSLLKSESGEFKRPPIIYNNTRSKLAIRDKEWVLIDAPTGGVAKEPEWFKEERGVIEHSEQVELFNLSDDPQQLKNLASENPEKVKDLRTKLNDIIQKGRSR